MTNEHDRLEDAQLDRLLDAVPEPLPSAALRRAIAEIPLRHAQTSGFAGFAAFLPFRSAARAALAGVLVVTLGAISGTWSAGSETVLDDAETTASTAQNDEWHDLSVLTFADELDQELEP